MDKKQFFIHELVVNGNKVHTNYSMESMTETAEEAIKLLRPEAKNIRRVYGGVADLQNWVILEDMLSAAHRVIYTFDT